MSIERTQFLTIEERTSLLRRHKLERDGRKKDRIKFILLSDSGWSYAHIAEALLLDDQTLRNYWKEYGKGGIESLLSFSYSGRPSLLTEMQYEELRNHLSLYSKQGAISLLKKMGFKYKKAKIVPGNPDVSQQEEFIKRYEEISSNLREDEEIVFLDGVHPTHNTKAGLDGY